MSLLSTVTRARALAPLWGSATSLLLLSSVVPACSPAESGARPVTASAPPGDEEEARGPLPHFLEALDGHGTWVEDSQYGTVWVPSRAEVGGDFVPYATGGHWAYDEKDAGYVWLSAYPWGWAPFHYGRWLQRPEGWAWVPGSRYAPAWVDWRLEEGKVACAPRPPAIAWRRGVAERARREVVSHPAYVEVAPTDLYERRATPAEAQSLVLARSFARPAGDVTVSPRESPLRDPSPAKRTGGGGKKSGSHGDRRSGHGGHGKH